MSAHASEIASGSVPSSCLLILALPAEYKRLATFVEDAVVPVLALDVYEHAYVRDFGATPDGRKEYVEAFFRNIDWDHVNRQLAQAEAAKEGADSSQAHEQVPVAH